MNKLSYFTILVVAIYLLGCGENSDIADAYGNFEATEILISSEANGKLLEFNIKEGDDFIAAFFEFERPVRKLSANFIAYVPQRVTGLYELVHSPFFHSS